MKIKTKKCIFFFRHAIFAIVFICMLLAYFVNDFKTDLSALHTVIKHNGTLTKEYLKLSGTELKFQGKREETVKQTYDSLTQHNLKTGASSETNSSRRLPDAIIFGVKKCGTRALLEYLRLHPRIKASGPEPHFFDRYYHLGLEWYRRKMPKARKDQMIMEKTPRYFVTENVPPRVYDISKTIKLILVVRDPVTRAISDFTQSVSKGEYNSSVTFRSRALRRDGSANKRWSAINIGLYANHLKKWLGFFSIDNIHVVDGENLIRNPIHELNLVQDFLGLQRMVKKEDIYMNATKGFPCIKRQNKEPPFKCFRSSKGRQHSYADQETVSLLRNFYKPYNKKFFEMTRRNFEW